jgi:hypothetical protein
MEANNKSGCLCTQCRSIATFFRQSPSETPAFTPLTIMKNGSTGTGNIMMMPLLQEVSVREWSMQAENRSMQQLNSRCPTRVPAPPANKVHRGIKPNSLPSPSRAYPSPVCYRLRSVYVRVLSPSSLLPAPGARPNGRSNPVLHDIRHRLMRLYTTSMRWHGILPHAPIPAIEHCIWSPARARESKHLGSHWQRGIAEGLWSRMGAAACSTDLATARSSDPNRCKGKR